MTESLSSMVIECRKSAHAMKSQSKDVTHTLTRDSNDTLLARMCESKEILCAWKSGSKMSQLNLVTHFPEHSRYLVNNLLALRQDRAFCDLSLHTQDGGVILAHTCVVAAFSCKIPSLLLSANASPASNKEDTDPSQFSPPVDYSAVKHSVSVPCRKEILEIVISTMYQGRLEVQPEDLKAMMKACRWLQCDGILQLTKNFGLPDPSENEPPILQTSSPDVTRDQSTSHDSRKENENGEDDEELKEKKSKTSCTNESPTLGGEVKRKYSRKRKRRRKQCDSCCDDKKSKMSSSSSSSSKSDVATELKVNKDFTVSLTSVDEDLIKKEIVSDGEEGFAGFHGEEVFRDGEKDRCRDVEKEGCRDVEKEGCRDGEERNKEKTLTDVPLMDNRRRGLRKKKRAKETRLQSKCSHKGEGGVSENEDVDGNIGDFSCPHCSRQFDYKRSVTVHIRKAHLPDCRICPHCGWKASRDIELVKHSRELHSDPKPFRCSQPGCTFRTARQTLVAKHQVAHRTDRPIVCEQCGQCFKDVHGLDRHAKSCNRLQEYLCDLCGQAFNHASSLKTHRASQHLGLRPFACSRCPRTFSDHRNLQRHMRIHDNIFPYACPICDQKFRHTNSARDHMSRRHRDVPTDKLVIQYLKPCEANVLGGKSYKQTFRGKRNGKLGKTVFCKEFPTKPDAGFSSERTNLSTDYSQISPEICLQHSLDVDVATQ